MILNFSISRSSIVNFCSIAVALVIWKDTARTNIKNIIISFLFYPSSSLSPSVLSPTHTRFHILHAGIIICHFCHYALFLITMYFSHIPSSSLSPSVLSPTHTRFPILHAGIIICHFCHCALFLITVYFSHILKPLSIWFK